MAPFRLSCQLYTGLLFWESAACARDSNAWWQRGSSGVDKASSNSEIALSHYLCIFWPQASIFINGDLADGMHSENRPKEPVPSETKEAEGKRYRKMVRRLYNFQLLVCCKRANKTMQPSAGLKDGEWRIFQAGNRKWSVQLLPLLNGSLISIAIMVMTYIYMAPFISSDLKECAKPFSHSALKFSPQQAKGWHLYLWYIYFREEQFM